MATYTSNPPAERFLTLAIAQSLIRSGYVVHAEQRHHANFVADLTARDTRSGKSFAIEIKFAKSLEDAEIVAEKARQHLPQIKDVEVFVVVCVPTSQTIFVDKTLRQKLSYSSNDFTVKLLKKSAN
jgi:hypothetical protein